MAKQRRNQRGSYLPQILMGVTLFGFVGLAGLSVAWASGYFESKAEEEPDRTGQLPFPALSRSVSAFERLTKEDFLIPGTQQFNVVWLAESNSDVIPRDISKWIGRVMKQDTAKGMVLTESSFLEKGTRPGLAAGVPPGKVALSIPTGNIPGLEQLRNGDRFDLMVSLPMSESKDSVSNTEPAALFGGVKAPSLRVGQLSRQHGVKRLVTGGMLVTLFNNKNLSTTGSRGLASSSSKKSSSSAVFAELAIDPEEIGPLTEAIAMATNMTCVVRSSQPGGDDEDRFSIEGMVPVITTSKSVGAFSQLSDENLIDEATGQLHLYYFPADKISDAWITDPTQLYGRVVSRDLRRGAFLTESDLLPPGTRPGITAGLPPGMSAMSIAKSNVQGFEKLAVGDRFSILTRVPEAMTGSAPKVNWATIQGGRMSETDAKLSSMMRTGIREIADDALFLSAPSDDTVVIGIPEQSVPSLAQLLRDDSDIFVVAKSSRMDSAGANVSPAKRMWHGGSHRESLTAETAVPLFADSNHKTSQPSRIPEKLDAQVVDLVKDPVSAGSLTRSTTVTLVAQFENQNSSNAIGQADDGPIAVPILVNEVTAFSEIQVSDLVDPATGRIRTLLFPRDTVQEDWILDLRQLIDRVAGKTLRAGRPVSSDDLTPLGTSPGPSAGLPAGMRGVTVNSRQIIGLETLQPGGKFDLVSAGRIDIASLADTARRSLSSPDAIAEASKLPTGRISNSRTLINGAILVADLGSGSILVASGGSPIGRQTQTRLTEDGSTVTDTVTIEPVVSNEVSVRRYILAVPEALVGEVLGLLDIQNPLFVSLRPAASSLSGSANTPVQLNQPPVRAVIREHVRGQEITSEVFLTDNVEPNGTYFGNSSGQL